MHLHELRRGLNRLRRVVGSDPGEKDAGELKADQRVTITLDPYPDVEFSGKVKSIEKLARPIDRDDHGGRRGGARARAARAASAC